MAGVGRFGGAPARFRQLGTLVSGLKGSDRAATASILWVTAPLAAQAAAARVNSRFTLSAMVTRFHSPRTLSRPRSRNWRNPSADLMIPNTGSGVCLRKAYSFRPQGIRTWNLLDISIGACPARA